MAETVLQAGDVWESRALRMTIHSVDMSRVGEELETSIHGGWRCRTDVRLVRDWIESTGAKVVPAETQP
jgi:hypothetical protein